MATKHSRNAWEGRSNRPSPWAEREQFDALKAEFNELRRLFSETEGFRERLEVMGKITEVLRHTRSLLR